MKFYKPPPHMSDLHVGGAYYRVNAEGLLEVDDAAQIDMLILPLGFIPVAQKSDKAKSSDYVKTATQPRKE